MRVRDWFAQRSSALQHPSGAVFEFLANLAFRNPMVADALSSGTDSLGKVQTKSATPITIFDPFLISAMRPRKRVLRDRISQVFSPETMRLIHGSSMTKPFIFWSMACNGTEGQLPAFVQPWPGWVRRKSRN
jgi:hypothetical protein